MECHHAVMKSEQKNIPEMSVTRTILPFILVGVLHINLSNSSENKMPSYCNRKLSTFYISFRF